MPKQDKNIRRAAVSALRAWSKGHIYAETLVDKHAKKNQLSPADRGLLNSLILAVLRNRRLLDHDIAQIRKGKLDHETRDILRVGLAQILILGIPDHAAVNETVNCGRAPVRGLINAVLRRAIDKRRQLLKDHEQLEPAIRYSHPDWLVKRWRQDFGKDDTLTLLQWNNLPSPTTLRLNRLKPESAELSTHPLLTPHQHAPDFFIVDGPIPKEWIDQGLVYIQDPATRHAVETLAPKPGETILDACAAPGGKSALLAAGMQNQGRLLCTDSNEKRLPRLQENLVNLGISISATAAFDWTENPPKEWKQTFDAILLDVPCSNTGVLRRRVDARWRLHPEQIEELTKIQTQILSHALPCLKQNGRLVYSTCSIDPEENENLVQAFAQSNNLEITSSHKSLPHQDHQDGSYSALLVPA
ncbi:MAG: 16S rRNA (cytosine(967)-C(5))-methyltransferase RsmB [Verrucomicrobiota bacterium]